MNLNSKTLLVLVVIVAAVVAGAYQFGRQQGGTVTAPVLPSPGPVASIPVVPTPAPTPIPVRPPLNLPQGPKKAEDARFQRFSTGNRNVKALLADGDLLWVGTSGGVIRYDTKTHDNRLYDNRSGLLSSGVFYLGKIDDRLAVGTYGGGLSLYDEKTDTWENLNIQHGLGDAFVYDALVLKNGDVWIATWSGANRIRAGALKDRSKWETFTVKNTGGGLPNDWVYGLAEGANGEVWIATEGGMARFKDEQWTHWTHAEGIGAPYEKVKEQNPFENDPAKVSAHHARQKQEQGLQDVSGAYNPNYVISMDVGLDGTVWAGTWGAGLSKFDGQRWINYTMDEGLPGNHVFLVKVDSKGRVWIGTNNGLTRLLEGDQFAPPLTRQDGLMTNAVFSLADFGDDQLWVGAYGGVTQLLKLN